MRLCLFIILAVVGLISAVLGFLSFIFVPKFIDCQVKEVYCLNFLISIGKGGSLLLKDSLIYFAMRCTLVHENHLIIRCILNLEYRLVAREGLWG